MKKIYIYMACAVILQGCNEFLEKDPDMRTELDTQEKVSQMLDSAYPQQNYIATCEIMSDNADEVIDGESERSLTEAFNWGDNYNPDEADNPLAYWTGCYHAIAAANMALQTIGELGGCEPQKGEALVARAYSHFMLVNLFAKFYNPVTKDSDPGIPYVTEPETQAIQQYDRGTVASVYKKIEGDLVNGLLLLNDQSYGVPAYHFTKTAAYAFATRYYLYVKNYDKVLECAAKAFPDNTIDNYLRPWNSTYHTIGPDLLEQNFTKATEISNLLLAESYSVWGRYYGYYQYGVSSKKINEILTTNVTKGGWAYGIYQYKTEGLRFVLKFNEYFFKENPSASTGQPHVMVPLFSSDEVLFNRAEAKVYKGLYDEAIADLNLFASKNIESYSLQKNIITKEKLLAFNYPLNPDAGDLKTALIQTILDFRRAAFIHEGLRWFDILRYNLQVKHKPLKGDEITLEPDDLRRVWQIPVDATKSGVSLNPR